MSDEQVDECNGNLCLTHRRKHGLIATGIAFELNCLIECEAESTCPLR